MDHADPRKRTWLKSLDPDEQRRRRDFQSKFVPHYVKFSKLPLSRARVDTLHGRGNSPVEVRVKGRWGDVHVGGPLKRLPSIEIAHSPGATHVIAGDDPGLQWTATQPPTPVEPKADDFKLVITNGVRRRKKLLFAECRRYLAKGQRLITQARRIAHRVHAKKRVSTPPVTR